MLSLFRRRECLAQKISNDLGPSGPADTRWYVAHRRLDACPRPPNPTTRTAIRAGAALGETA